MTAKKYCVKFHQRRAFIEEIRFVILFYFTFTFRIRNKILLLDAHEECKHDGRQIIKTSMCIDTF